MIIILIKYFRKIMAKKNVLEPLLWKNQFDNIKLMRNSLNAAPIDLAGCETRYLSYDENMPPKFKRFSFLVSCILSSQNKDETTTSVMNDILKKHPLFDADKLINMPEKDLEELIKPVRFFKVK